MSSANQGERYRAHEDGVVGLVLVATRSRDGGPGVVTEDLESRPPAAGDNPSLVSGARNTGDTSEKCDGVSHWYNGGYGYCRRSYGGYGRTPSPGPPSAENGDRHLTVSPNVRSVC